MLSGCLRSLCTRMRRTVVPRPNSFRSIREPKRILKTGPVRQQCVVSLEPNDAVKQVVDYTGGGFIIFSTDYPHGDSKYPQAVDHFQSCPSARATSVKYSGITARRMTPCKSGKAIRAAPISGETGAAWTVLSRGRDDGIRAKNDDGCANDIQPPSSSRLITTR